MIPINKIILNIHNMKLFGIINKNKSLQNKEVIQNNYLRICNNLYRNEIACSNWNDLGFLPIL